MLPLLGLSLVMSGCTQSSYDLPQRTAEVRAEEGRLAGLVEPVLRAETGPATAGSCRTRLLGQEGTSTFFVWAHCTWPEGVGSAVSLPARIDGSAVQTPVDGAGNAPSVRELFPSGLAAEILDHPDRLRP